MVPGLLVHAALSMLIDLFVQLREVKRCAHWVASQEWRELEGN